MLAFARLLSALTFLLSLGVIANALPSTHRPGLISHRQPNSPKHYDGASTGYTNDGYPGPNAGDQNGYNVPNIQGEAWSLKGKLDTKLALLVKSKSMEDAKARVGAIVDIINEERSRLPDTPVHTSAEVHLKIAHVIIKVFVEVVSACAKLSLKFGAPLVIDLLAEIDTVFSGYLSALTGCVPGLGQVLNNLAGNINGDIVSDLRIVGLTQCVKLLDLVGNFPGVAK